MQICNPMSSAQLDEVVDTIGPVEALRVLDVACGYGELLIRCAESAPIVGLGIDLSPWMICGAAEAAATRPLPDAELQWVLGEARDFEPDPSADVAVCIGAEWVWHDFGGTVRALVERVNDGGALVVGAARLHLGADQQAVRKSHGVVESIDDMAVTLHSHGLHIEHRVDPDDAGWDDYLARTHRAAEAWAVRHPGPRAERWLAEQRDWQQARERDREVIGWSVWIARKTTPSA